MLDSSNNFSDVLECNQLYSHVCNSFIFILISRFSFSRSLTRDILFFPSWSNAAKKSNLLNQTSTFNESKLPNYIRESLSNILLTHVDFRRPMLHHKNSNISKDDETIERKPESCIEEFNLYVSTWKGWQGALPSKENRITWEQVERENTIQGTVSCTHLVKDSNEMFYENETNSSQTIPPPIFVAEPFSYSISKIPKSNLMLLYVNHSQEASLVCPKLLIKRKPVEFTRDELCTRLKTTPFRERPHKCFFVHDDEKKPLFTKCSASHPFSLQTILLIFILLVVKVFLL